MTDSLVHKFVHILAHIVAAGIVFVSMPYCVYTVGAAYHTGLWEPLFWSMKSLMLSVLCSSILLLGFPYFLKKNCKKIVTQADNILLTKRIHVILWILNSSAWLICLGLAHATVFLKQGLWQYASYHDRYFSNSVIDHHFFPPAVGIFGIYLILVGYSSWRTTTFLSSRNNREKYFPYAAHSRTQKRVGNRLWQSGLAVWMRLLFFLPVAGYYGLLWFHQFIPQPRFIG